MQECRCLLPYAWFKKQHLACHRPFFLRTCTASSLKKEETEEQQSGRGANQVRISTPVSLEWILGYEPRVPGLRLHNEGGGGEEGIRRRRSDVERWPLFAAQEEKGKRRRLPHFFPSSVAADPSRKKEVLRGMKSPAPPGSNRRRIFMVRE